MEKSRLHTPIGIHGRVGVTHDASEEVSQLEAEEEEEEEGEGKEKEASNKGE